MKFVNGVLILVASLLGVFFAVAAFLPDRFEVERSVEIKVKTEEAYRVLVDLGARARWDSVFRRIREQSDGEYRVDGSPGAQGHALSWKHLEHGEGRLILTDLRPGEYVRAILRFQGPNPVDSVLEWTIEAVDDSTCKVSWVAGGDLSYPSGRVVGLFIKDFVAKDIDFRLVELRNYLETPESRRD